MTIVTYDAAVQAIEQQYRLFRTRFPVEPNVLELPERFFNAVRWQIKGPPTHYRGIEIRVVTTPHVSGVHMPVFLFEETQPHTHEPLTGWEKPWTWPEGTRDEL